MLCGELVRPPSVGLGLCSYSSASFAEIRSPFLALLGLSLWQQQLERQQRRQQQQTRQRQMANVGSVDSEDVDVLLENGLLSFENPGYHLVGLTGRLDDALNSNTTPLSFHDLYEELDSVCKRSAAASGEPAGSNSNPSGSVRNRTAYAHLDIASMGVDGSPVTNLDSPDQENNHSVLLPSSNGTNTTTGATTSTFQNANGNNNELDDNAPDIIQSHHNSSSSQPVSEDSSESESSPQLADLSLEDERGTNTSQHDEDEVSTCNNGLPLGWERHEDKDGPYYWHIKSGTIQREIPREGEGIVGGKGAPARVLSCDAESGASTAQVTRSTSTNSALALSELEAEKRGEDTAVANTAAYKRRSYPAHVSSRGGQQSQKESRKEKAIRFAVRSLGWVEIAEEDLTPERSSKAVNRCIMDLSLGKKDLLDAVGRWGDGKDLFMDLDEGSLKLVDPETLSPLNAQPIHTIRVWGVGRDNGRDFAYVARDRSTRRYMCHVFRCDMPARTIANTLRDICKRIMIERSLQGSSTAFPPPPLFQSAGGLPMDGTSVVPNGKQQSSGTSRSGTALARPTNLPTERRRFRLCGATGQPLVAPETFPTPMEEPKKVLRVQYLGSVQVLRATGMDILNDAIDRLSTASPAESWPHVEVAVAPSMITVSATESNSISSSSCQEKEEGSASGQRVLAECRVRYLSFLGIGKNVKRCAFIMHTAQDQFQAHVFHCEPSSGALCKTVEAACKLRYQKCLDAYPQRLAACSSHDHTPSARGIGATLKSVIGSLTGRRRESDS